MVPFHPLCKIPDNHPPPDETPVQYFPPDRWKNLHNHQKTINTNDLQNLLRKETERPEAVAAGTVKIAGVEKDDIVRLAKELLDSEDAYYKMAHAANPYGDGEASRRTVEAILYAFGYSDKRPENFSVK